MNMDENNYVDFEEAQPEKKSNRTLIIVIAVVAVVICCCCIGAGWALWTYGDSFVQNFNFGY